MMKAMMKAMNSQGRRLAEAVELGRADDVEHLLGGGGGGAAGADPNALGADGLSPIVRAATCGHVHIVKILLRRGAGVDSVHPTSGRSALHLAAATGPVPLARLVLSASAEVEKLDGSGSTPLQLAAGAKSGDMIRELVSAGARLDVADTKTGDGVLHLAAFSGNPEVVERLLRAGADLEARNRARQTALHVAAREGRFGLVKCLVRAGSDVSVVDVIGRTPLYVAAANGHKQVVMGLVASGADPSVLTLGGISALTAAAEESKVLVMEALLKLGLPALGGRRAWADALCSSARKGLADALAKLLPAGGPGGLPGKKFLDRTGTSPLHCAAAGGHIWCVMLLLEAGADETSLNRHRCTPLEITGTSRREGLENVEMDDRIRRALIKAFVYRSLCWAWPVVVAADGVSSRRRGGGGGAGRKARGSSSLSDAAAAAAAAAAADAAAAAAATADRKLFEQLSLTAVAKLRIFRQEHLGEPPGPAATAHKIIRYSMKTGTHVEPEGE